MRMLPLVVAASFASTLAAQAPAPIFRYISLGFARIELGKPFTNAVLSRVADDSTRQLRNVTFGGADSIALRHDKQDVLRAILFSYPSTYDWGKEVRDYSTSLGRPTVVREEGMRSEAEWRDAATSFRVWCAPVSGRRRCGAELRDRAGRR